MPRTNRRSCATRRCIVWLQIPMGPPGNGRQRLPAALFLLLGLTAALAYFHDDVAVFSLRLRATPGFKKDLAEAVQGLKKAAEKYKQDADFLDKLKKEHKDAKGSEKNKVEKRFEDWMKHCNDRRKGKVRDAKKHLKEAVREAKGSKNPEDHKEAAAAEKTLNELRKLIDDIDKKILKYGREPM